jgi:hypothetical protein
VVLVVVLVVDNLKIESKIERIWHKGASKKSFSPSKKSIFPVLVFFFLFFSLNFFWCFPTKELMQTHTGSLCCVMLCCVVLCCFCLLVLCCLVGKSVL